MFLPIRAHKLLQIFIFLILLLRIPFSFAIWHSDPSYSAGEEHLTAMERMSKAQSQLLQQLQKQLMDTQDDLDKLRGQIQENAHQIQKILNRQQQLYQDLSQLRSPKVSSEIPARTEQNKTNSEDNSAKIPMVSSGNAAQDYERALSLVHDRQQFDHALKAFEQFIKNYPDSTQYLPNAHYWLGQLNFNAKNTDKAAYHFALVVKDYPKSSKAPESLYKIGLIMEQKNESVKAKAVYQRLMDEYPNSKATKLAKKRLT